MQCPPFGLCLPCEYVESRDGDTVVVRVKNTSLNWAIRLIDTWAPEVKGSTRLAGLQAKTFVHEVLEEAGDDLRVFIPAPEIHGPHPNLLQWLTFDRIPGYIFVDSKQTLNQMVVAAGHATETKQ